MTRQPAAEDFAAIRARLEELRQERARMLTGEDRQQADEPADTPGLLPAILRAMAKAG